MEVHKRIALIARETGLTVDQCGTYLVEFSVQDDGSWLVHFARDADREPDLAAKLPVNKIMVVSKQAVGDYKQGNC